MSETRAAPTEHAIREQAYYFWEQDGRPHGREAEYWTRAVHAVNNNAVQKPGERTAKAKPKLKAVASKASTSPAKSAKPSAGKPKKK
jgi:hypothetical protein